MSNFDWGTTGIDIWHFKFEISKFRLGGIPYFPNSPFVCPCFSGGSYFLVFQGGPPYCFLVIKGDALLITMFFNGYPFLLPCKNIGK